MLVFAYVSIIPHEVSDQSVANAVESQLAYMILIMFYRVLPSFFSVRSSPLFDMRNQKLKEVKRLTDGHTDSVSQGFLLKPMVFDLLGERHPKFKGGVMY